MKRGELPGKYCVLCFLVAKLLLEKLTLNLQPFDPPMVMFEVADLIGEFWPLKSLLQKCFDRLIIKEDFIW